MSFCMDVKNEIAAGEMRECCKASKLYGVLSFAKSFTKEAIVITSLSDAVMADVLRLFDELGVRIPPEAVVKRGRSHRLEITDVKITERVLLDLGYTGDEPSYRIKRENFMCDQCARAFIAGCFLTGGTVTEPQKGYHLEFSGHKLLFLIDFFDLLREESFEPKMSERRSLNRIVYFKDSAQIEDLLTYMGAPLSSMELMDAKIEKDIINRVNRRTNCESANIDKIVLASYADNQLIEYIIAQKGEDYLPEDLREVAMLRLENPEMSLAELGALTRANLSKSGVNHRLRKIRAEAQLIKEQQDAN